MRIRTICAAAIAVLLSFSLVDAQPRVSKRAKTKKRAAAAELRVSGVEAFTPPEYTYEVVGSLPHDRNAFTQGLIWRDGMFVESTGLYGRSSLREVEPISGAVVRNVDVAPQYFAEGLTELDGKLYQLTWREQRGFVYDATTFAKLGEFTYSGEGWGLTHDGESLIMSDGTNEIRFLDPATFEVRRTIRVYRNGQPLTRLNELEYIDGQIYANVWQTDFIARIDPSTGWLRGWIDMSGLLPPGSGSVDVLNGIAYDEDTGRIFVTGKLWPWIFEVRFVRKER